MARNGTELELGVRRVNNVSLFLWRENICPIIDSRNVHRLLLISTSVTTIIIPKIGK